MQLSCTHWFWAQISQRGNWRLVTHGILRAVLVIGNPLSWIPTTGNLKMRGGRSLKIFFIPTHKILDQPWRNLTSLKLCKCSHVPHLSPRVISNLWQNKNQPSLPWSSTNTSHAFNYATLLQKRLRGIFWTTETTFSPSFPWLTSETKWKTFDSPRIFISFSYTRNKQNNPSPR